MKTKQKKNNKIIIISFLFMFICGEWLFDSQVVQAAVVYDEAGQDEFRGDKLVISENVELKIIAYDEQNSRSLAIVETKSIHSPNAEIEGNGVRLRAAASTSAKILELMYDGEPVWIDWSKYGTNGLSWQYIQRIKTGTYGWVYKNYVTDWD